MSGSAGRGGGGALSASEGDAAMQGSRCAGGADGNGAAGGVGGVEVAENGNGLRAGRRMKTRAAAGAAFLNSVSVFASTLTRMLEEQLERAAPGSEALTLSQLRLLTLLTRGEGMRLGEVAQYLCVSDAAASRAVDRLVQRGWVSRRESREDRRAVRLAATRAGRGLLLEYHASANEALAETLAGVETQRLGAASELLDALTEGLLTRLEDEGEGPCFGCNLFPRRGCVLRRAGGRICSCESLPQVRAPRA